MMWSKGDRVRIRSDGPLGPAYVGANCEGRIIDIVGPLPNGHHFPFVVRFIGKDGEIRTDKFKSVELTEATN